MFSFLNKTYFYKSLKYIKYTMFNIILSILGIIAIVWVIYDVWTNSKKMKDSEKIVWTVLALLFSVFTTIFYYFLKKK